MADGKSLTRHVGNARAKVRPHRCPTGLGDVNEQKVVVIEAHSVAFPKPLIRGCLSSRVISIVTSSRRTLI